MITRTALFVSLVATLFIVSVMIGAAPVSASDGYSSSNAGIVNVQASTTPLTRECPASAPWLRDPDVCAIRWSKTANDKSESDLAVDPTDPQHEHIVGMSKFFWSPRDYLFNLGWYDSTDGGKTWTNGILPGYKEWMDTTDPTVAFDSDGNLYALVLPFNFVIEPNGGHNWDIGHVTPEGLNDAIFLSRSLKSDGPVGQEWQAPVLLATYHSSGLGITADKQWVGADTFGLHKGSVYASWIVFDGLASQVVFAVSEDHGAHFSEPMVVTKATTPKFNEDPYVFEGPEGQVYVSYDNLPPKRGATTGSIQVVVSHDNGKTFSSPGDPLPISPGPTPYLPDTFRDGIAYSMTVNPANGHLIVAYENYDHTALKGNINIAESVDEGRTWHVLGQVNDPSIKVGDTFQPKIFAAGSGVFGVAFYDRRLSCPETGKTNTCIDVTIQFYNLDRTPLGGNRRVTHESWDPNVVPPHPGGLFASTTFIGDYFGGAMTSDGMGTKAHLLFVSTSTAFQANAVPGGEFSPPYQQQVYASVPAPVPAG